MAQSESTQVTILNKLEEKRLFWHCISYTKRVIFFPAVSVLQLISSHSNLIIKRARANDQKERSVEAWIGRRIKTEPAGYTLCRN